MSRKIYIKSQTLLEVKIALEVASEMQAKGCYQLSYDEQQNKFINKQLDDIADDTIAKAVASYGLKLQEYNATQIENKAKEKGYITSRKIQDGKIKIIAIQRVYA